MDKKTDIRNMLKDAIILFVITLVSGVALGYVYEPDQRAGRSYPVHASARRLSALFAFRDCPPPY